MVNIIKNFGDWKMIKESEILNSKFQEILSISNLKIIPLGNTEKIEFSKIKCFEDCLAWQLKYTSYFSKEIL